MVFQPLKSILLKLNSSFKEINWRCLHKLFSKLWNNQTSGASCLSRCLIYKVHTVRFTSFVSRRVLSLSLRPAFVKNFFQVFQTFSALSFAVWRCDPCAFDFFCPVAKRSLILSKAAVVVNTFFQFSSSFFHSVPFLRIYAFLSIYCGHSSAELPLAQRHYLCYSDTSWNSYYNRRDSDAH